MCDSSSLRSVFILAMAAVLTAGCDKAPEYQGEGPKMEFVRIPAGSFHMGSPPSEEGRDDNEGPVHEVRITKPFYMGKYEVTQAQWEAVMGMTVRQQRDKDGSPWRLKGEGPEHPIYYVSWEEAAEFCKRLGRKFRLPTEAEWEYACRAGSQTSFYLGDDPNYSELDRYAWYYGKSENETHPVGQKQANEWGLHDMYGNISEWCLDRYPIKEGYKNAGTVDPMLPATDDWVHVTRGGSWLDGPEVCRSASRNFPDRLESLGFRVVFTGGVRADSKVLEIALQQKSAKPIAASERAGNNQPADAWLVPVVVRDDAGMPIDDLEVDILPQYKGLIRRYANGEFEVCFFAKKSEVNKSKHYFVARHMARNLVAVTTIDEATKIIDFTLAPGIVVAGEVIGSDGKGVERARITTELRESDWEAVLAPVVIEAGAEGRFEIRALPPGYAYALSARSRGYRIGRTEIRIEDVRDSRVDGVSIVLPKGEFSISGVVVDTNGRPVPEAGIWCSGEGQIGINVRTDADGGFKADGIFAGKVNVMASVRGDDGKWAGGSITVEAGATDVRVVLGTGEWSPPPKGRACFPGDTRISVDGAVVPISEVGLKQEMSGMPGYIERIDEHEGAFECRDILLDSGNRISVVDSHCFMLDCGRWIAAQDLKAGLRLKTITGTVGIKSVTIRPTPYTGKVYNLKISSSDRYAVGKDGVIVRDY